MSMKLLLKQQIREFLYYLHHVKHEKFYKRVIQMHLINTQMKS